LIDYLKVRYYQYLIDLVVFDSDEIYFSMSSVLVDGSDLGRHYVLVFGLLIAKLVG